MLILPATFYIALPILTKAITLISTYYFAVRVPNIHWNELTSEIHHGDVLLMADAPKNSIRFVDRALHEHHPDEIYHCILTALSGIKDQK